MKTYVAVALILCAAGAVSMATVDGIPNPGGAPAKPYGYNPAFGDLIRSFVIHDSGSSLISATGIADTYDHYLCVGSWNDWDHFAVYTTVGSLVRTVAVTTAGGGYRDGSGRCHLGNNYFVTMQSYSGPYYYSYAAGGTPNGTGKPLFLGPFGRGIAWDGTYYYATISDWSSAIGKYTSTGSLTASITGPYAGSLYGLCAYPGSAYLYAVSYLHYVARVDKNTGSVLQSFITWGTAGLPEGGGDMGPEAANGYLYLVFQGGAFNSRVYVHDSAEAIGAAVAPASLGKIKAVYR